LLLAGVFATVLTMAKTSSRTASNRKGSGLGRGRAAAGHPPVERSRQADRILGNRPFKMSRWGGDRPPEDARWKFCAPTAGNDNFAWVQRSLRHLVPTGTACFVLGKDYREKLVGLASYGGSRSFVRQMISDS
jgi:hypothetical protein